MPANAKLIVEIKVSRGVEQIGSYYQADNKSRGILW